jgi:hypothetical protein
LLAGWAVGIAYGTVVAFNQSSATTAHFGSSLAKFPSTNTTVYIALTALLLNLVVAAVLTPILRAIGAAGVNETHPADHYSDVPSPEVLRAEVGGNDSRVWSSSFIGWTKYASIEEGS